MQPPHWLMTDAAISWNLLTVHFGWRCQLIHPIKSQKMFVKRMHTSIYYLLCSSHEVQNNISLPLSTWTHWTAISHQKSCSVCMQPRGNKDRNYFDKCNVFLTDASDGQNCKNKTHVVIKQTKGLTNVRQNVPCIKKNIRSAWASLALCYIIYMSSICTCPLCSAAYKTTSLKSSCEDQSISELNWIHAAINQDVSRNLGE